MSLTSYLKKNYWLVAILLLAALLRLFRLEFQSIWLDEIYTMIETSPKNSASEVYSMILKNEQQPPFYFFLIYSIFKVTGHSLLVLRVVSALAGIGGVLAIYHLGKELVSRNIGLFAAFIACVNPFHLMYSQDGRPYALFFLFTTLGFLWMLRYIKAPTLRHAVIYGLFGGLMLNGHFYALFALTAQYIIIFFFMLISDKEKQKAFFLHSVISGVISVLCFLPALQLFRHASGLRKTWITTPEGYPFTDIFKGFFADSEFVLAIAGFLAILYFIRISREQDQPLRYDAVIANRTVTSAIVLITWMVVVMVIPLIRTYLTAPMIVGRYLIGLLPAAILILAIGLDQISNNIVRVGMLLLFFGFSMTTIVIIRKFYNEPYKAEWHQMSRYMIERNKAREPIVTSWGWHFSYFLDKAGVSYPVIDKKLNNYIADMMRNPDSVQSFWVADAERRPYEPADSTLKFIQAHYIITDSANFYDAWTKHFVRRESVLTADTLQAVEEH